MVTAAMQRVQENTAEDVNERIADEARRAVGYFAFRPEQIDRRLRELDEEWDIERTLAMNMSALALTGVALGALVDRRFLALPAAVLAFYVQHQLQGWCPPLPIMRRLGVRTAAEIAEERYALKALRGDFRRVYQTDGSPQDRASAAVAAARWDGRAPTEPEREWRGAE